MKPQVIEPRGMGPGFWPTMIVLTAINVAIAIVILFTPLDWILPGEWHAVADRAADIDVLFKFMGVFGIAITVYVAGFVIYAAFAFRRRRSEPYDSVGVHLHDLPKLEFWWTAIPTLLLIVLVVLTIRVWHAVYEPLPQAMTMEVVGHQFDWEARYPGFSGSVFTPPGEMHLPVGKPLSILISSADVLHGFWVPEFRLKADAVPGLVQTLNMTATRPGKFQIACSEYCGVNHSHMVGTVVVESPEAFERWLAGLKGAATAKKTIALTGGDANAGKALFGQKCAVCHAIAPFDQKIVGPGLLHITDDPQHPKLVNGADPTPEGIAGILRDGYTGPIGSMPNRQANGLSDKDIANLVAYLTSLK
jgi:cytochrome c oxidase subunit 2